MAEIPNPDGAPKPKPPVFGVDTNETFKRPTKKAMTASNRGANGIHVPMSISPAAPPTTAEDLILQIQDVVQQGDTLIPKPQPEITTPEPKKPALKPGDIMPIRPGWVELSGPWGSEGTHELEVNTQRRTDLTLVEIRRPESGVAPTFILRDPEGKLHYYSRSGKTWRGKSRR